MDYPLIDIDFEVYSEVDLKAVGLDNYAKDPSTKVICMAYKLPGDIVRLWRPGCDHKIPEEYTLVAHNAAFELAIIESKSIIPVPREVICTAARAAVMTYPRSLENASMAMKLPMVKDTEGRGVMLQVTKPRRPSKTNPETNWFFDKDKMNRTYRYCIQDVDVEHHIYKKTHDLYPVEKSIYDLDAKINKRGIAVDTKLAANAIKLADQITEGIDKETFWLTKCELPTIKKVAVLKKILEEEGLKVNSLAKDKLDELLERKDLTPKARRLLELRKEGSLTSIAKYRKILDWTSSDNRLRNLFLYYGAGTGRWTGRGPQLHNLPRGIQIDKREAIKAIYNLDLEAIKELGKPSDILSSCIRETFWSPDKMLIAGDYSGIEVRVLAWLAGERDLLTLLEEGGDPYVDMASRIYGVGIDEVTKDQRAVGKMAILGLGYGMGHKTFVAQCAQVGIILEEQFAKEVVRTYRTTFKQITSFWNNLNSAFIDTTMYGELNQCSNLELTKYGEDLMLTLPSGRPLWYIKPSVRQGQWGMEAHHYRVNSLSRKWEDRKTYGGMLAENVTQAVARDILADAMLRMDKEMPIVLHVHDEIVVESDREDAEEIFNQIMSDKPEWAKGLPIQVETWKDKRYKK